MDKSNQEQILKIFQSLFSKEQLRKNLYLFQYLNPDMTLRIKTIYQQRKVAAVSKDYNFIFQCLKKCPLVKAIDQETICILITGDALIVRIRGNGTKEISIGEIKKNIVPLLKDIKYEIRQNRNVEEGLNDEIQIQLQSQTSAIEFIERIKAKNSPIIYELKQKDPYQCIKKSVKYLLKQRKNQQQGNFNSAVYYAPQTYPVNYYHNYTQNGQSYNYQNYQPNKSNTYTSYPIFIRKAVESQQDQHDDNSQILEKQKQKPHKGLKMYQAKKQVNGNNCINQNNKKSQTIKSKDMKNVVKFDSEEFPTL